jgi:hypothetical protein
MLMMPEKFQADEADDDDYGPPRPAEGVLTVGLYHNLKP